jgi:Rrf2 family transcriptional regulator, nitric oxide-sensitive transcriptional repressor
MKLQISSQLAIYAVLELIAHPDRSLTVSEIGARYGVSNHHLAKVMNVLARAGLIRSARGAGGGYQFSGNARRTTLLDLIELFEKVGPVDPEDAGSAEGSGETRALLEVLREIDDIARATLGSITLATLCKLVERHRGDKPRPVAGSLAVEH